MVRKGMWVVVDDKVGIVASIDGSALEIHFVDEVGNTFLHSLVPTGTVRQATYEEIPEERRPDETVAKYYGYL
jgi:hypothetical protein